jgi:hypothetical protein
MVDVQWCWRSSSPHLPQTNWSDLVDCLRREAGVIRHMPSCHYQQSEALFFAHSGGPGPAVANPSPWVQAAVEGHIRRRRPNHHLHNLRQELVPTSWSSVDLHLPCRRWAYCLQDSYAIVSMTTICVDRESVR